MDAANSDKQQQQAISDIHGRLRHELLRLEHLAWSEARALTHAETTQMMRALQTLRVELVRHINVAEQLPFDRAHLDDDDGGLLRRHIADQWVVERAVEKAFLAAHGKVASSLQHLQSGLCHLFESERALSTAAAPPPH